MRKSAFTIAEVLFAIILLSTSLVVLAPMHLGSLRRIMRGRGDLQRVYILREKLQKLLTTPPKTLKTATEKREVPETEIKTSFLEITKKSALGEFGDDIVIARVDGTWEGRTQTLITFLPKPKEEKK